MLRSDLIYRMTHTPGWAPKTVPYSMENDADCSAYVSAVLGIARQNTVTLVTSGFIVPLGDVNLLKPGDLFGHCGPGTEGANGHVGFFNAWLNQDPNDNHYYAWEQTGPDGHYGPNLNLVDWPIGWYAPYRFRDVVEDAPKPQRRSCTVVNWQPAPNTPWNSTLSGIANHYGTTVSALQQINGIANPNVIYAGQVIWIDPA